MIYKIPREARVTLFALRDFEVVADCAEDAKLRAVEYLRENGEVWRIEGFVPINVQDQKQVADYEAELERHSTDRVLQRKELAELRKQISELEPRAAFGDQCWQDSCEGALVEATLLKAQTERAEKAEARVKLLEESIRELTECEVDEEGVAF